MRQRNFKSDQLAAQRLAAILAVDVASYTRLMEEDTDGAVSAWKSTREDVINPLVGKVPTKIIKFTGDGFLAEFISIRDAVNCAIDLQMALVSSPLDFRMGIHLVDVTNDGIDGHGEGVNMAERIEASAEPGGIYISSSVFKQVHHRIEAVYIDMGEQSLKNVSEPIRTYPIRVDDTPSEKGPIAPAQSFQSAEQDKP